MKIIFKHPWCYQFMDDMKNFELGALSFIDDNKRISSAGLVKRGRIMSLGQEYRNDMPQVWFHGPFFSYTYRDVQYSLKKFKDYPNNLGSTVCRYELSDHSGTHIDGLNHASRDHLVYGNVDIRDITDDVGTISLGIETMPPVFTRGIMLDFTLLFGVDFLDPGYEITVKNLEEAIDNFNLDIREGDGVFFHTGYGKLWVKDNKKYMGDSPGPGEEGAKCMVKQKVSITGADTSPYEVTRSTDKLLFPCHQILIRDAGMHLVENLRLEELSSEGVHEFLFICAPLKLKGGAGSPVSPLAVY